MLKVMRALTSKNFCEKLTPITFVLIEKLLELQEADTEIFVIDALKDLIIIDLISTTALVIGITSGS